MGGCYRAGPEGHQPWDQPLHGGLTLQRMAQKKILVLLANLVGADTLLPPAAALPRGLTASPSLTHTRQSEARPDTADT